MRFHSFTQGLCFYSVVKSSQCNQAETFNYAEITRIIFSLLLTCNQILWFKIRAVQFKYCLHFGNKILQYAVGVVVKEAG
jgi:hypothetical protein